MKINAMIPPAELAVSWLTMFLVGTELFVFSPLLPTLAVNYDISLNVAGLCVTTFSITSRIELEDDKCWFAACSRLAQRTCLLPQL